MDVADHASISAVDLRRVQQGVEEHLKQDQVEEALSALEAYLGCIRQEYGEDDPQSSWALRNCGLLLGKYEQYAAAEPYFREWVAVVGFDEPNQYSCEGKSLLGWCLFKTGQFSQSRKVFEELMDDQTTVFEWKDPRTIKNMRYYLESLLKSSQPERAASIVGECRSMAQSIDDHDSKETKMELLNISGVLLRRGKCKLGHIIVCEVLVRQRRELKQEQLDMSETEHRLDIAEVETYAFKLMKEVAEEKRTRAMGVLYILIQTGRWNIMKNILGECHIDTIEVLEDIANFVWEMNRYSALALSRNVFEARRKTLGDHHPDTASARETLRSRMASLNHPEAPFLPGGDCDATQQADTGVDAHPQPIVGIQMNSPEDVATDENCHAGRREDGNDAHQNPLCQFCRTLEISSYLTSARVGIDIEVDDRSPIKCQTAESLLAHRDFCPLCHLVVGGFVAKCQLSLAGLEPNAQIKYEYLSSTSLDRSGTGFVGDTSPGMEIDALLLQISFKQQRQKKCLWVRAFETGETIGKDCAERIEHVANTSLVLEPDSQPRRSVPFPAGSDVRSAFSLLMAEQMGQLREKVTHLGEYGYLKGRCVGELVDIRLLQTWMHCCDTYHGDKCKPHSYTERGSKWRPSWLIDVRQSRLVQGGSADGRYAALSYVWGDESVPQLKHTAVGGIADRLKSSGGLSNDSLPLPLTVKDAIELCRQMEIPYLWVDAICLDQDNIDNHVLRDMSKIYQCACVTIVAASGQDSQAGLSGIRCRSNPEGRIVEHIGNLCLGLYMGPSQNIITDTKWVTRAWTFQEMLLSKRLLIFTEKEVLYQCSTGISWRESVFLEHPQLLSSAPFSIPSAERSSTQLSMALESYSQHDDGKISSRNKMAYSVYKGLVSGYLHRQITDESDTLKAIQGILTVVEEKMNLHFINGIPVEHGAFQSLLFNVTGSPSKHRRHGFPSWSWCGWQGFQGVDDARTPGFKFPEEVGIWFEPAAKIYWLDNNSNTSGGVYSFCAMKSETRVADAELPEEGETDRVIEINIADMKRGEEWKKQVENMLVFSADTLRISISKEGEAIPWDRDMQRCRIESPPLLDLGLGFKGIDIDKTWQNTQKHLDLVAFAEAKAFDDDDVITIYDSNKNINSRDEDEASRIQGYWARVNFEAHLVAQVAVLLVETDDTTGISQRIGLYDIEKEHWDRATGKCKRRVYLC
ncbi:heterokaryon incompatibility protein-domain-containing protein [Nemania sp. FL0031]|nr:heterokaryon incompatibility protein-domain-containing protein [Nemania sp. FL0031]